MTEVALRTISYSNWLRINCAALTDFFLVNCTILFFKLNFCIISIVMSKCRSSLANYLLVYHLKLKNAEIELCFVNLIAEARLRFDLVRKSRSAIA